MTRPRIWRFWKPRYLVWLALPLAIWWLARGVPLDDWRQVLLGVNLANLGLLVLVNVLATFSFSSRWWLVLRALSFRLPYLAVLRYRLAAFSISYFTPGTQFGGEPLQVYALEKNHHLPRSGALASVVSDKLFELLANFSFLAIGVTFVLQSRLIYGTTPFLAAAWIVGLLVLPLLYLIALGRDRRPLSALLARPRPVHARPRLERLAELVSDAEAQVARLVHQNPKAMLPVLASSVLIWIFSLGEYWLAIYVLGARLTLQQTVIALTVARLAFLTPLPGGLGVLEAGQVLAMQALGFSPALGIAISLWIRLRDLILGALGLVLGAFLVQSEPKYPLPIEAGDPLSSTKAFN
jgi:hypothetical protein